MPGPWPSASLDQAGNVVYEDNLAADSVTLLHAIAPFRDGLVVACECRCGPAVQ